LRNAALKCKQTTKKLHNKRTFKKVENVYRKFFEKMTLFLVFVLDNNNFLRKIQNSCHTVELEGEEG